MIKKYIRKLAAKHLLSQQNKPQTVADLTFAFVDSKGMRYYTWPTLSNIPVSRYSKLMEMIAFGDAKLEPTTLMALTDEIEKRNFALITEKNQKAKLKLHSQITVLLNEIKDRQSFAVPKEILTRIAAIVVCREDEAPNPKIFNEEIHELKVQQFKEEFDKGFTFFLTSTMMKELYDSLIGTNERLARLSLAWELDHKRTIQRLKIISQGTESSDIKPESAK